MDVSSAASIASTKSSVADNGLAQLAENFDNFLTILTSQLQNQDPLDPLDSNEFTAQLVQFTGVEQAVAQNKKLEQMVELLSGDDFLAATGYIGKTVEAEGNTTQLQNGSASWTYDLPQDANTVMVTVLNSDGQQIISVPFETAKGEHTFTWDGTDSNGLASPEGKYTLQVAAKSFNDDPIGATMTLSGKVTGVENTGQGEILMIGDVKIPVGSVLVVKETPQT